MGQRIKASPEYFHDMVKVRIQREVLEDIEAVMVRDMVQWSRQDFIGNLVIRGLAAYEDTRRYVLEGVKTGRLPPAANPFARYEDIAADIHEDEKDEN